MLRRHRACVLGVGLLLVFGLGCGGLKIPTGDADDSAATESDKPAESTTATDTPVVNTPAIPSGPLWVVLSNFRMTPEGISTSFSVDYRIVQGSPKSGAQYVLVVSKPLGTIVEQYIEFPLKMNERSGTVGGSGSGASFSFGRDVVVYFAEKKRTPFSTNDPNFEKISGELRPGGPPTESTPPPTFEELAGPDAEGKLIALANPRVERGIGSQQIFKVDYKIQGRPAPGMHYHWIVKPTSGEPIQFDVSTEMRSALSDRSGTFSGRPIGSAFGLSGPFEMHIERTSRFGPGATSEVVSNKVTAQ